MGMSNSLIKNSFFNVSYKLLNILFPLITTVYVSRIILAEGVGKVTAAQNILSYFAVIAPLGIPTYGVKKIAESRDSSIKLNKVFTELFIINAISTIVCCFLYYMLIFVNSHFRERQTLYAVIGVSLFFNLFNVDWFYQGIEEYGYIMIRNAVVKAVAMLSLIILVKDTSDYFAYAIISSGALVANYLLNAIYIRKYVKFSFDNIVLRYHYKPIIMLLATTIAIEIYTLVDTSMLTFLCGDEAVGLYDNSTKIIKALRGIVTAVCAVFLPRMSYCFFNNELNRFKKMIELGYSILITLSLPVIIGLLFVADDVIITFLGNSFCGAIILTQILSLSILTVALSGFFGNQVLIVIGKEKILFISTVIGATINILFNYLLINLYGPMGAAVASVITEFGVVIFQVYILRKEYLPKMNITFYLSVFISLLVMSVFLDMCSKVIDNTINRIFISVIGGALVYVISLIITRNEVYLFVKKKIVKK